MPLKSYNKIDFSKKVYIKDSQNYVENPDAWWPLPFGPGKEPSPSEVAALRLCGYTNRGLYKMMGLTGPVDAMTDSGCLPADSQAERVQLWVYSHIPKPSKTVPQKYNLPWVKFNQEAWDSLIEQLGLSKEAHGSRPSQTYCISYYDCLKIDPEKILMWKRAGLSKWRISKQSGLDTRILPKLFQRQTYREMLFPKNGPVMDFVLKNDALSLAMGRSSLVPVRAKIEKPTLPRRLRHDPWKGDIVRREKRRSPSYYEKENIKELKKIDEEVMSLP